jgi:anti-sigma B factor antagonist
LQLTIDSGPRGVSVARPSGRLDLMTASKLKRALGDAVADGRQRLVVDMEEVSYLDSSGLGALVGVLKTARQAGGDMRIARPPEQALVVLELTTLDRVLTPYASVDEAVATYD